jgi:hypothetical protein
MGSDCKGEKLMKSSDLKIELINKIVDACKKHIEQAKIELADQVVFSYVIYCSSGCRNMGAALCTRKGLKERNSLVSDPNEPAWYGEVTPAEWDHVNEHYELFSGVDDFINRLYEIFYDEELEDIDLDDLDDDGLWQFISGFFIDAVVKSFAVFKESGCFDNSIFEDDVLFGMQFGDPDQYSVEMIEQSSQKLNSNEWHRKIQKSCDLIRSNL